ncbi:MAG: SMC-Scp complex subunit ScpB [Candidatus Omnitrophica bacterium]|nr:SMC-Scp complex subunit ScpB [Candidatus Omnitrophota bacterium]
MDKDQAKRIIEALLFVSDKPVSIDALKDVLKEVDPTEIRALVEELNGEYSTQGRSFSIKEIAGGFQMLTDPLYSRWISALYKRPPDRLSGPSLETLAIIAYRQPITRTDIEGIRGVNVDGVLKTLEERGLIRTKGRVDGPGRPILYGTTSEFLQHFGLKSLEELPKLKEFKESDLDFVKMQDKNEVVDTGTGKLVGDEHRQLSGLVESEGDNKPAPILDGADKEKVDESRTFQKGGVTEKEGTE